MAKVTPTDLSEQARRATQNCPCPKAFERIYYAIVSAAHCTESETEIYSKCCGVELLLGFVRNVCEEERVPPFFMEELEKVLQTALLETRSLVADSDNEMQRGFLIDQVRSTINFLERCRSR